MSYYTEGYIRSIGIGKGNPSTNNGNSHAKEHPPVKADTLCIEVVAPYKVLLCDKEFALFIKGDGDLNSVKVQARAKIKEVGTLDSVDCKSFDAQFLLVLKQTHSKVRFVFNSELTVLERVIAV